LPLCYWKENLKRNVEVITLDPNYVAKCAQIASVLEVSGHPKPGNVHRTRDFEDMVFEDFLISGVVIGDQARKAASRGLKYGDDPDSHHKIRVGNLIKESVLETDLWVENNTNLGIIMLIIPLSAAAGMSKDLINLRENLDRIMRATTPHDAVDLYNAINVADAGGMGEHEDLSVSDESSVEILLEENINLFQVLEMSSEWDMLSYELTHTMNIAFEIGHPIFHDLKGREGINTATVHTFLSILSQYPDTLIQRKYGEEIAIDVSRGAKGILDMGGILNKKGRVELFKFEEYLLSNNLNPGTTADLTASSIMVDYLGEYSKYKQ
jgi:triphosphoribosyl-dephospho-CoA synthase